MGIAKHCNCNVCKGAGVIAPARTWERARNWREMRNMAHNLIQLARRPETRGSLIYIEASA